MMQVIIFFSRLSLNKNKLFVLDHSSRKQDLSKNFENAFYSKNPSYHLLTN